MTMMVMGRMMRCWSQFNFAIGGVWTPSSPQWSPHSTKLQSTDHAGEEEEGEDECDDVNAHADGEDEDPDDDNDDDNEVRLVMGSRHEHTAGAVTKGMWRTRVRGNLTMQRNSIAFLYIPLHQGLIFRALYCVSSTVQGSSLGVFHHSPGAPLPCTHSTGQSLHLLPSSSRSSSTTRSPHWRKIMSQLVSADCLPYRHLHAWTQTPAFFISSSSPRQPHLIMNSNERVHLKKTLNK